MTNNSGCATIGVPGRNHYRVDSDGVDMRRPGLTAQDAKLVAEPQSVIIDLSKTALIIVDMQNDFCDSKGWMASIGGSILGAQGLVSPINSVTRVLREKDVPIIWLNWGTRPDRMNLSPGTRHTFHHLGNGVGLGDQIENGAGHNVLEQGSWGADLIRGLEVGSGDIHIDKHRISGFQDTPLDSILRTLDIRTTIFAGINADHCVLATLMEANFHGYDTILIEDCTATTSPDFCLQATLHNVRFCFGFTVKSKDIVTSLAVRISP